MSLPVANGTQRVMFAVAGVDIDALVCPCGRFLYRGLHLVGQQETSPKFFRLPLAAALAFALAATLAIGCGPQIGDSCENNDDCPEAAVCDTSVEDGFCTVTDCRPGDCPSESLCVEFSRHETYCMKSCETDEDCRDDHACLSDDDVDGDYCFVAD